MLGAALWAKGHRYLTSKGYTKKFGARLIGSPDLIFSRQRVTVFLDGCFWHNCPTCKKAPDSMPERWLTKLSRNRERDLEVTYELARQGWQVLRVWEHELRGNGLNSVLEVVTAALKSSVVETK